MKHVISIKKLAAVIKEQPTHNMVKYAAINKLIDDIDKELGGEKDEDGKSKFAKLCGKED
jgi:hypothetical protein